MIAIRSASLLLLFAALAPAQDVAADVADLLRHKDDADPALITRIAATKSREGAEGLVRAYEAVGSILRKREVLAALGSFDGVPDAEQPALAKVAQVAGSAEEPELRDAALSALGQSKRLGKHFLRQLVDSEASDAVREPALREHVRMAAAEDGEWYKRIWNLKQEQRKDKDGKILGAELNPIRELAFAGVQAFLSEDEVVEAMRREVDPKIRRAALNELKRRNSPKLGEMAAWVLDRVDFPGPDRAEAARILIDRDGPKVVGTFLELAKKRDVTTEDLRAEMARLIAALNDDATNKKVQKLVGKGKPHEKVFALIAAEKTADLKLVRKDLADPAIEVRRAASRVLGSRRDRDALPELRAMLAKGKNPGDQRLAVEAISAIEQGSSAWLAELVGLCAHADANVRNTAVEQLGLGRNLKHTPVLLQALEHADWSTRLAAVDALAEMRDKKSVGPLIERLGKDPGRLARRIGEVLWTFTAQPFDDDAGRWKQWWSEAGAGAGFELATAKEVEKAEQARELQRLRARTRAPAQFFGLQIESHRVIFVIDVSGSMLESMYGHYVGKRGAARIDVAREQTIAAIRNLDPAALFNVYAFSSGVARWREESAGTSDEASRAAAIEWVERLGAQGATNIYDSLKLAFADKDVDSIYLMSDGEPTNGEVIDPHRIREDVAFWNKHRKIKIHTVAIGANLELLEWLAADAGGKHVKMR